jgi:hypothetical protein
MNQGAMSKSGIRVLPKLCGADVELGNFEAGVERAGGTGYEASRALLAEIEGYPLGQRTLFDGRRSAYQSERCGRANTRSAGTSWSYDPQDVSRRFLASNGGCAYIDLDHLELCVPEVVSAFDHVAAWHAMLRIARGALERANEHGERRIHAVVNNSDGLGHSYGSHLNFLISRRTWDNIFYFKPHYLQFLASFQISSILLTGSGKVGAEHGGAPAVYQLSQRADFFEMVQSLSTTIHRGVVNSRDEALCGPSVFSDPAAPARLHVIFFDSALAHGSALFRVGLMQLILTLIEQEQVNSRLILDDPLLALQDWSRDVTMRATARLIGGERLNALELQYAYLEEVERHAARGAFDGVVPRAAEIIRLWADSLGKFARNDLVSLAPRLDWVMKLMAIERAMDQNTSLSWTSPEVKLLDMLYGSLDDSGLYFAYEAGGFAERLVSEARIARLVANPPAGTRAWTRAMLLRRAEAEGTDVDSVDWDRIRFRMRGPYGWPLLRTVDLADPLGFTRAGTHLAFETHKDFGQLLDALERGNEGEVATNHSQEGEQNALSGTT